MSIFKAYDIRGTVPDQMNEEIARRIGNAYAGFLDVGTLLVGRDMRTHSPGIAAATIEGVRDAGVDVVDVGLVTTPMSYFAVGHHGYGGGLMVTASHNPGNYNGFKMCREDAAPVSEDTGIRDVERLVVSGAYRRAAHRGGLRAQEVLTDYVAHVRRFATDLPEGKVVADAANGMAGIVLPALFEGLRTSLVPLYLELDGTFPNHEANPLKSENLRDLRARVVEEKALLGIAFDGDADRCAFVDEAGEIVGCDLVTALIAQDVLAKEPGAGVLYDLRSSKVVRETIEARGGRPFEERVGHSFMKATMRREGIAFGGELSGHYYFRENYYADSAMIAAVRVINLVGREGKPLSELVRPLRRYHPTGEINFHVEDKDGKIEEMAEVLGAEATEVSRLDGITIRLDGWWFNVRKSNTEPVLRLNLEGDTEALRDAGLQRLMPLLGSPID